MDFRDVFFAFGVVGHTNKGISHQVLVVRPDTFAIYLKTRGGWYNVLGVAWLGVGSTTTTSINRLPEISKGLFGAY